MPIVEWAGAETEIMTKEQKPAHRAPRSADRKPQANRAPVTAAKPVEQPEPAQDMLDLLSAEQGYDFDSVISSWMPQKSCQKLQVKSAF